ncbi:unnamed protein product [Rotaria socialis]|uniref:Uncharacterized protein n=1 Tax=Rotaria socialis TaxID=392032 RepID=A0A821D5W3_9BILA|nr:unnamed protein product [Rotaria socialis]CAF4615901.1 unnamed protein product [Rotaria socialis]
MQQYVIHKLKTIVCLYLKHEIKLLAGDESIVSSNPSSTSFSSIHLNNPATSGGGRTLNSIGSDEGIKNIISTLNNIIRHDTSLIVSHQTCRHDGSMTRHMHSSASARLGIQQSHHTYSHLTDTLPSDLAS